jgi:hypothetical protein
MNHLSLAARQLVVPAESDGGACAHLPEEVPAITVVPLESGPRLRAVELRVPPSVQVLDLSRLAPAPWVCIVGGAGLKQLRLPPAHSTTPRKSSSGAHIHLALDAAPALRLDGGVSALDACWPDPTRPSGALHKLRTRGPGRRAWNAVWIGESAPSEAVENLILYRLPELDALDLTHLSAVRCLELHQADIARLRVRSPTQLTIEDCPRLVLATWSVVERAVIRDCAALRSVHGDGRALSLSGVTGADTLEIRGDWARLGLRNSTCVTLEARGAGNIRIQGESTLESVFGAPGHLLAISGLAVPHAPEASAVGVEPSYIEVIARLLARGQPVHPQVLEQWIDAAHGPSGIQDRLMAIAVGLAAGSLQPETAWALRSRLVGRGGGSKDVAGNPAWQWDFMPDLADRGWAADLDIWWTCRRTVARATEHDALVRRTHSMLALAALAEALRATPSLGAFLHAAFEAPLPKAPRRRRRRGPYPHEEVEPDVVFGRVVRGLVRARRQLDVAALGEALARNIYTRILHNNHLVGVLASLQQLGVATAADCLAELATNERLDPQVQREALVALLAAPHPDARPLLAHQEASA